MSTVASTPPRESQSLIAYMTSGTDGLDLLANVRGRYGEDLFFNAILQKPKEYRNFEVDNDLIYLKDRDLRLLCIPKVMINRRSVREIVISEAHSLLAHLGASKTLDYLRDHVWWK
ncbi:hypothetical protein BDN70DRAFT_820593, partial [Pholiota conissans]